MRRNQGIIVLLPYKYSRCILYYRAPRSQHTEFSDWTWYKIHISTDSQSSLSALNPLKILKFGKTNATKTYKRLLQDCEENNCEIVFQWIPVRTNLPENTQADKAAKQAWLTIPYKVQLEEEIEPASLKTLLKQHYKFKYFNQLPNSAHLPYRSKICYHQNQKIQSSSEKSCT